MGFVCHDGHVHVAKAAAAKRPKWNRTRSPRRLEALSARFSKAVRTDLVRGVQAFRRRFPDKDVIYQAWRKGEYAAIDREIPWEQMPGDLAESRKRIWEAMQDSQEIAIDTLPPPIWGRLRFDYKNPRIERVWRTRTGERIVNPLIGDGRSAIQGIVHRQFTEALSPRFMAGEIRNYVGLYPQLAGAHTNYVLGLMNQGVGGDRLEVLSDRYYDKLLDYRANMIARTETQFAINRGQLEVWHQGRESGLLPASSRRVWVVDGNPCEDCQEMSGAEIPIDGVWTFPDGSTGDVPTDIHPHCECIETLEMGGEEE